MTIIVKNKVPLVIPPAIQKRAGLKSGQEIEFRVSGNVISVLPKMKTKTAQDEYTPTQRRIVDKQLKKGLADVKAGRVYGPFDTAAEMALFMEADIKKFRRAKRKLK